MTLLHKRILVLFSFALNIGFIITAIIMVHHHSISPKERSWMEMINIIHQLNLSQEKEAAALDMTGKFKVVIDKYHKDIKQAHKNILFMLAKTEVLNQSQLHKLIETARLQEKNKNKAFEDHVLELREQLGNEKGALFFSLLLEHIKLKDRLPPR